MFGYTPAGLHADPRAPPAPLRSVAIAAGSVFGSGGSDVETGGTRTRAFPPAHGSGFIAAAPRVGNALWSSLAQGRAVVAASLGAAALPEVRSPVLAPGRREAA